jgi:hypothetical protein
VAGVRRIRCGTLINGINRPQVGDLHWRGGHSWHDRYARPRLFDDCDS